MQKLDDGGDTGHHEGEGGNARHVSGLYWFWQVFLLHSEAEFNLKFIREYFRLQGCIKH